VLGRIYIISPIDVSFPIAVSERVLVTTGRHCALCHKFCGIKIELHHIKPSADGGLDSFENCIPLCFDCHADMRTYDFKHPKGKKYTESELIAHRDSWYSRLSASGGAAASQDHLELDRRTWISFRSSLPYEPTIRSLRNRYVGAPYAEKLMIPIYRFVDDSEDPGREYLDADLEGARAALLASARDLTDGVTNWTFPTNQGPIHALPHELKYSNPDRYYEQARELSRREVQFIECYDNLVRNARRKLGVDIDAA